ncbi:sensor histidine kinase [Intrasporangium flavum]|uniref:sensor histidine kinase n=1 Tax=Intrasporangium flavum TaxID=1428657 RepID=UPI001F609603|nr:sensor histidine kinase [Intrasporangium flavum]
MTPRRASRRRVPATRPDLASGRVAESNPWEKWGWIVQSVWLVFLVFPVISILTGHLPAWQVALGLVVTAAFGAVYARGAVHLAALERRCEPSYRLGALYVGGLVACMAVMAFVIGADAVSYLPFVVSFAMFALPRLVALAVAVLTVAAAVLVAVFSDGEEGQWVVATIVFAVAAMTAGVRLMSDRGREYESMSRELALVEERERVARDVHDVLGHSLTVVTVKAELAERLVDLDPERARAELAEIQALSRQALAEIRATVGGLRAARLDAELDSARTALAGAGIEGHVPTDHATVDPRHRTVLAWVLREAMTNVVRHSDADACWVELDSNRLTVRDDGRGLEDRPEGNGIRGIRERVEAAGGRLSLATGPEGHGTVLEVTL